MSYHRNLGAYFSSRDLCQMYLKSIEAKDIRNEDGIPQQFFMEYLVIRGCFGRLKMRAKLSATSQKTILGSRLPMKSLNLCANFFCNLALAEKFKLTISVLLKVECL